VIRSVDGEAPTTTRYEYDAAGRRRAMLGGDGLRTEYTYDRRHRLKDLVKKTAAGAVLLSMAYTVDASGLRTALTERDAAASGVTARLPTIRASKRMRNGASQRNLPARCGAALGGRTLLPRHSLRRRAFATLASRD
jgi:uncharacterized protein RhaS with RHS repeats